MIPAWKNPDTEMWEPIRDNPTILSLDGEFRAPLATIMAESWTWNDRAKFGVFDLDYTSPPDGYAVVSTDYIFDEVANLVRERHAVEPITQVDIPIGRVRHPGRSKAQQQGTIETSNS